MFDEEMNAQSESIPESSSAIPCCPSVEAQETMGAADGRVSGWRGFFWGVGLWPSLSFQSKEEIIGLSSYSSCPLVRETDSSPGRYLREGLRSE